jgi:peptide deformylase
MKRKRPDLLPIRLYGDRTLRKTAEPVSDITSEIREFIDDLVYTMYEKDGVGLAAPQVGRSLRIFVIDPFWFQEGGEKNPKVLVNPEFLEFEGQTESEEGCLSLPEIYEKVMRARKVIINGLNENGEKVHYEAEGLFSRALQHENDHLDGILFTDKVPKLKKILLRKKLNNLKRTTDENGINVGKIKL